MIHHFLPTFLLLVFLFCIAAAVQPRNLTLGAKAEMATGKLVEHLDRDTKVQLMALLTMNSSRPV